MTRVIRSLAVALPFLLVFVGAPPVWALWSSEPVTGKAALPTGSSLVIRKGVHVAWGQPGTDDLFWAKKTATGWQRTVVTGKDTFGNCYSTEVDYAGVDAGFTPAGTAVIAHACIATGAGSPVKYSTLTDAGWKTKTIGNAPDIGPSDASASGVELVFTATGKPIIVVSTWQGEIARFTKTPSGWTRVTLASVGLGTPTIAAGWNATTGQLAVATVSHALGGVLAYAEFDTAGDQVVDESIPLEGDEAFGQPSLAFAADGEPVISFQRGVDASKHLRVTKRVAGVWTVGDVVYAWGADVGASSALVVKGGIYHVAYDIGTGGDLGYASSPDADAWALTTVVPGSDLGELPSMAVTGTGGVRISYFDRGDTALGYATGP